MRALRLLWRGWMLLGALLGWINTRIILTIVFLLIVIPIAFTRRIRAQKGDVHWHERTPATNDVRERMRRLH